MVPDPALMPIRRILLLPVLMAGLHLSAQPERCGTEAAAGWSRAHQRAPAREALESWIQHRMALPLRQTSGVLRIPVVVHVLHNGEAPGAGANISQAQIQSQIEVLNEDFRRLPGSPGFNTHPSGADTEIEFCLALTDPAGQLLAEPGIERIRRQDKGFAAGPYTVSYAKSVILPQTIWDPERYCNLWVMELANDFLGFAQYPDSSSLGDLPVDGGPHYTDGIVIRPASFGRTGSAAAPYHQGRTTTHEIGHWLGLWHIWGDGPCSVDDFCTDTPPADAPHYGCPAGAVSCGFPSMIENYMDYSDDLCMSVFTACQKQRMRTVLEHAPRRRTLPASTVCDGLAPPQAQFASSATRICAGSSVQFSDRSLPGIQQRSWSFPGGEPAVSTDSAPVVAYSAPGLYPVSLAVYNTAGGDTLSVSGYLEVLASGGAVLLETGFENGWEGWTVDNPDADLTWALRSAAGSPAGSTSAAISLYDYPQTGRRDALTSPPADLRGYSSLSLSFRHAYRPYNLADPDSLLLLASTDGGSTFPHRLLALRETGSQTFATQARLTSSFTPQSAADWCGGTPGYAACFTVDLSAFAGQPDFRLRFVSVNGYGNNIWLDDIRLSGACALTSAPGPGAVPAWRLAPNPAGEAAALICGGSCRADEVLIVNHLGQTVQRLRPAAGLERIPLDLAGLPAGLYQVQVSGAGQAIRLPLLHH
ncbi:MAG: M43 family zinc metalloprotease [Bacteroidia bacterium]|nr:M43 family zinc metalloprotease [Bacteroidia bacterium]